MIELSIVAIIVVVFIILWNMDKPQKQEPAQQPKEPAKEKKTYSPYYLARLAEVKRLAEERGDTATVQAVNNMTYDGPLPVMKPNWTFCDIDSEIVNYKIAGINYQRGLKNYEGNFIGYLQPEPQNKYDPNAIAIHHRDGKLLGYIPADQTDEVREITSSQFPFEIFGDIEDNIDYDNNRHYHTGIIHLEIKSKK